MDGLTPAYIDPVAIEYAETTPTVLPIPGYTSLWDAKRIQRELNFQHFIRQTEIARTLEDDTTRYKHLNRAIQINIESSEELRDTLFSSTGPVSILAAGLGIGIGGYLIQRPTDKKRIIELENGKA
jgi:hypothetical protein